MAKRKERRCKICGAVLEEENLWLCDGCQAAGMGEQLKRPGPNAEELRNVAQRRQELGVPPLEGMTMEEINELARCWMPPFNTYGKFRGYVSRTGRLPPEDMRKHPEKRDESDKGD